MKRPQRGPQGAWLQGYWLQGCCLIACLSLVHCRGSDATPTQRLGRATPDSSAEDARTTPPGVAGSGSGAEAPAATGGLPDWCSRLDGAPATIRIVNAYHASVRMNCAIAGLISDEALTDPQYSEWRSYLELYSGLLAGCSYDIDTPAGGILVFGPANTPFVGADRAKLSNDEARLLIEAYVQAFGDELLLGAGERDAVRTHLSRAASSEIDPVSSGSLATCGAAPGQ